jgi:sugar lactone lactonase YvrE
LFAFAGGGIATEVDADYRRATIKPTLIRLEPGQEQKFKVIMAPRYLRFASLPKKVKWSVNDIAGGNRKVGTIDKNGLYRAPVKPPRPHEIHICAEVQEASNRYVFATVLIGTADPPYKLIRTWSEPKENRRHLEKPHGICLDKKGNILIADQGNSRVLRFTPEGKYLGDIGLRSGNEPGHFNEARVVITDTRGSIWVSDSKPDGPLLQSFTAEGKFIRIFAHKGILPGQLLRAHGMGFDGRRRLFVVDVDNFRINVYSDSGKFLYDWGKPGLTAGTFNAPHGLTVDPSGDVFVSNFFGPTQKFDPNGNFLFAFAHPDPPDGPVGFHSIAGDRWGNVYVTVDTTREGKEVRIAKYNNNGDYVTAWGLAKPDHHASWFAVDNNGAVYVLFGGGGQMGVQVFAPQ